MARHIFCVLDRTVGHVSICWDYVSIFIDKNSNYNQINQISWIHLNAISKNFRALVDTKILRGIFVDNMNKNNIYNVTDKEAKNTLQD